MKTIEPLLLSTLIFATLSTGACLAPDDEGADLELRAYTQVPDGGHDCDCPDCTALQRDSCWAITDRALGISLGYDRLQDIAEGGGQAVLRAKLGPRRYAHFTIVVPPASWSYQAVFMLEEGTFETLELGAMSTEVGELDEPELDELSMFMLEDGSAWLVTSLQKDFELMQVESLSFLAAEP